jgi:predicted dehydrogenase
MKLRVGILGCGRMLDRRYRPALRALTDRFEVRAVCDQVHHLAQDAAKSFSAIVIDGYQSMIQRTDIDAVLILSKQWFGNLPMLAACAKGKSVYCATGLGEDLEDVQRLRTSVEEAGITFMAELPRRHAPATIRLKELIATKLGSPKMMFCHVRRTVDEQNHGRDPLSFDSNNNELVEQIDWCSYIVGRPANSVTAIFHSDKSEGAKSHDYQMASLRFDPQTEQESTVLAQISDGCYVPSSWSEAVSFRTPAALQITCEKGIAFIDLPSQLVWFDEAGRHQESLESERPISETMLYRFYRDATSLVRQSSIDDAYRALDVMVKAKESAQTGQQISI